MAFAKTLALPSINHEQNVNYTRTQFNCHLCTARKGNLKSLKSQILFLPTNGNLPPSSFQGVRSQGCFKYIPEMQFKKL